VAIDALLLTLRRRPVLYGSLALAAVLPPASRDFRLYFQDWATAPDTYGAMDVSRMHEVQLIAQQHAARNYFADSDISGRVVRLFLPTTEQDGWTAEPSAAIPIPSHLQGDTLYVGMTGAALNELAPAWLPGLQPLPQPINPLAKPDFTAFTWSYASASRFLAQFARTSHPMRDFEVVGYLLPSADPAHVRLDVLWRPLQPNGPYDMYVHLLDSNGKQVGGSDRLVWPVKDFARAQEGGGPVKWGYYDEGSPTDDWLLKQHTIAAAPGQYTAEIGVAGRDAANPNKVGASLGSFRMTVQVPGEQGG
jgi:hypothetical protein